MGKILLFSLSEAIRKEIIKIFQNEKYVFFYASAFKKAIEIILNKNIDVVILGHRLHKSDSYDFLNLLCKHNINIPVIFLSDILDLKDVITAIKQGAFDFLIIPLNYIELKKSITRALANKKIIDENIALKKTLANQTHVKLIGTSPVFQKVLEQIQQVATTRSTVLIIGESGTGKELVAEAIHNLSPRAGKPFVKINCGAVPEPLLESELFGHEKGAFTGAVTERKGRFEAANYGTLFLDEVGEMNLTMQVKLLRVLETGEFEMLGSNRTRKVDVRIIAATNRNLEDMVANGTFREDLYYRLNVFTIEMPPLRERIEDIPILAQNFLENFAKENNKKVLGFTPEVEKLLISYHWPGNIRELKNVMERAVILCKGEFVEIHDIPTKIRLAQSSPDLILMPIGSTLEEIEREAIRKTLLFTKGDKMSAAKILGIGLATLYRKLKKA